MTIDLGPNVRHCVLSEAEVVRSALTVATAVHTHPSPRLPLLDSGEPTLAERVDEELANGFGE
jgi:hypothetical protein